MKCCLLGYSQALHKLESKVRVAHHELSDIHSPPPSSHHHLYLVYRAHDPSALCLG